MKIKSQIDRLKNRKFIGALRKLGMGIAMLLIILNLTTIAFTYFGVRDEMNWMPITLLTVESGSMEPEYSVGDLLIAVETAYEEVRIGDDICYTVGSEIITHRVVRSDGDSLITQGLANDLEDSPIDESDYCGRIILCIPALGSVLYVLQSPWFLLAITLILLGLCYGGMIFNWIRNKEKNETYVYQLCSRSVSFLLIFTLVAVMPYYTAAKYVDNIYDSTILSAGSMYFTSNYLTQRGSQYGLRGWDGESYEVTIELRNYENDLLVSQSGKEVYYGFEVIPTETTEEDSEQIATYGEDYTITITTEEIGLDSYQGIDFTNGNIGKNITNNQKVYTMPVAEDIEDKNVQYFTIKVEGIYDDVVLDSDGNPTCKLEDGDVVSFSIEVSTSEEEHFQVDLSASFELTMSEDTEFIKSTDVSYTDGSNVVSYSLSTTLIDDDEPMKEIKISWDPTIMYINEFESTAFKVIAADEDGSTFSKGEGWIIFSLQAYSSIELQFFLVESNDNVDDYSSFITAVVVGEEEVAD